ncbi:anti-sigma B factor RsbW [Paenibacillus sp. L3-i20]|uniref:anti-sigma B factor RsbW n=1 Tax=Paenibacillus sp. L3-i20 TaxID=2905833 RepID=UPI001EDD6E1A|nr:anti-sigma B factor RsbW [Paenibacillus sp. L3-i20]GKU76302.1 serine-protein kinase RsbW [Paenibacillus sp. L3-i20]
MKYGPIQLTIPAKADYLDIVRSALYGVAVKCGFSFEDIEDMKVAITEACTNAILHAYEGSTNSGSVDISFMWNGEALMITVRDYGRSYEYNPGKQRSSTLHYKPLNEVTAGGLGIFMMQALMDDVEVCIENGTEVVLTKRMSRSEEMV